MKETASRLDLELRDLHLRVGDRELVRKLNLRIRLGEMWSVLGANGAGKTTLLRTIAGLHRTAAKAVLFGGRDITQIDPLELAQVRGYVPQALHDTFSTRVIDVVLTARHPHLLLWEWGGDGDHYTAAMDALSAVNLREFAARDVTTLSGGERQRVGIATLLAQDVSVLLLDEPVASLDLHHQISVLDFLNGLARDRGRAIIYSIHDINLAYRHSTHCILFLGDGNVVHGPARDVINCESLSQAFHHPIGEKRIDGEVFFFAKRAAGSQVPATGGCWNQSRRSDSE